MHARLRNVSSCCSVYAATAATELQQLGSTHEGEVKECQQLVKHASSSSSRRRRSHAPFRVEKAFQKRKMAIQNMTRIQKEGCAAACRLTNN